MNSKVLIVSMACMAETGGPSGRCRILAEGFREAGIEVATCMAEDVNFRKIEGVDNYYLDVPMPLGLPEIIAKRSFPIAQKLGITSHKTVSSFDEVLLITGNLDRRYLRKSVESVRRAIREFGPDVVYSEFSMPALIAAKLEGVCLFTTVSYPTQYDYAHRDSYAKGLNALLSEKSLTVVRSALDLFDLADVKICPSIRELEPFTDDSVIFCGALRSAETKECQRRKILVYMGNGTISPQKMEQVVSDTFAGTEYEVHIASAYLEPKDKGNLHVAPRWDFNSLLDEAVLFINHGGQNSVIDGLLHGVPQIMVPGKVYERKFNAKSIAVNRAGLVLQYGDFEPSMLRAAAEDLIESGAYRSNAEELGEKLKAAGGVSVIIGELLKAQ
ncbi:MAG: glycosyltransferase [Bacillota bacterium]